MRNNQGYISHVLYDNGVELQLTETFLGVLGYCMTSGYFGSSLWLELYWNSRVGSQIKNRIKTYLQEAFSIINDSEETLSFYIRDLRSYIQEYGLDYSVFDAVVPSFLLEDYADQTKAFLKGTVLGSGISSESGITVACRSFSIFKSMVDLCQFMMLPLDFNRALYNNDIVVEGESLKMPSMT